MEDCLNFSKIEALKSDQKGVFRSLIEGTVELVDESNKSRPEVPNLSNAVPDGDTLFETLWRTMLTGHIVDLWKEIGTLNPAQEFGTLVSFPGKKFAGFFLRGKEYPIFAPEALLNKELVFLSEPETRQIYISLGGSGENAENMFPADRA